MSTGLISLEELGKARALKSANTPPSIFKYREVNDYSLQNLESDTVWLCSANQYNDPYDCCCTFDMLTLSKNTSHLSVDEFLSKIDLSTKQFSQATIELARKSTDPVQYLLKALVKQAPLPETVQLELTEMLNHVTLRLGDDMISQINVFFQQSTKVCSFSERNDSIAMWGHYAKSHQGICIEYEVGKLAKNDIRRHALMPVRYSSQLFNATEYILHGGRFSFNNLFSLVAAAHKSDEWSYEKEWRLVIPFGPNEPDRNYHMPKPKAVYIGTKITSENEQVLREVCKQRSIPVKRMRLSQREFRLEVE